MRDLDLVCIRRRASPGGGRVDGSPAVAVTLSPVMSPDSRTCSPSSRKLCSTRRASTASRERDRTERLGGKRGSSTMSERSAGRDEHTMLVSATSARGSTECVRETASLGETRRDVLRASFFGPPPCRGFSTSQVPSSSDPNFDRGAGMPAGQSPLLPPPPSPCWRPTLRHPHFFFIVLVPPWFLLGSSLFPPCFLGSVSSEWALAIRGEAARI